MKALVIFLKVLVLFFLMGFSLENKRIGNPECIRNIYVETGIYHFGFLNKNKANVYTPKSLKNILFKGYGYLTVSKVLPYGSRKNTFIENEHYLLVELKPRIKNNEKCFSPNRYEFLPHFISEDSVLYTLSYAEINTSAEHIYSKYPINEEEISARVLKFSVKMPNGSISVGSSKKDVKKALDITPEKCIGDTLKISDDAEDSFYFFNNDSLYKIVFNLYNG